MQSCLAKFQSYINPYFYGAYISEDVQMHLNGDDQNSKCQMLRAAEPVHVLCPEQWTLLISQQDTNDLVTSCQARDSSDTYPRLILLDNPLNVEQAQRRGFSITN
jgi:hypothetical protein